MNDLMKNLLLWTVIALVLLGVFRSFGPSPGISAGLSYSDFLAKVEREQVLEVKIAEDRKITGKMQDGQGETYECAATFVLVGAFMIVHDNDQCGGMNVRFDGVYQKATQ